MTTDLRKVAVVSNAGSLAGRAIALALARRGWHIALLYQGEETPVLETLRSITALNLRAAALPCALDGTACADALLTQAAHALEAHRHAFSCIVTLPSRFGGEPVQDFSLSAMDRHMHANLGWPLLLARALHDVTPAGGQSVLIGLVDPSSLSRAADPVSYGLSQSAMHAAIPMLARSLAPKMRVVGITGIFDHAVSDLPAAPNLPFTTPEDIASAVCFAAESPAITGTSLLVDGGRHLTLTA